MFELSQKNKRKGSYSQSGEDVIVDFIFECKGINKITYLDIGANHPFKFSNTAYFYNKGCKGINVDANPLCIERFKKYRNRDINLNVGIGLDQCEYMPFYVLNHDTMSTFSKEEADQLVKNSGMKIEKVIDVKMMSVSEIVDKYSKGIFPDFLTVDAEGLDFEIFKSIDYSGSIPKVICLESVPFGYEIEEMWEHQENDIVDFLKTKGYVIYARTGINTIMFNKDA